MIEKIKQKAYEAMEKHKTEKVWATSDGQIFLRHQAAEFWARQKKLTVECVEREETNELKEKNNQEEKITEETKENDIVEATQEIEETEIKKTKKQKQ